MTAKTRRRAKTVQSPAVADQGPSKLDQLTSLLTRTGGATLDEMMKLTGWQGHSIRGAMAGALKKRGHGITSVKEHGVRRYHIGAAQ
jgi:hypothetical protein